MMTSDWATPVIVGVGDISNPSLEVEDATEPMELMLQAIHEAIKDTGLKESSLSRIQSDIDSIDVVQTWTWPYQDLPILLSKKLGVEPNHKFYSVLGGNQPAKLLDEASRRISQGKAKVAVITGGEALASLSACMKAGKLPPPGWSEPAQNVESVFSPSTSSLGDNVGAIHSIGAPIQVYPLYENGFRAHRNQSIPENHQESASLYASFSEIASQAPFSRYHNKSPETIETISIVSDKNRMISYPYPLLMNAFNTVNLAAACLLTSTTYAEALGIPRSKWIYPLGGAGTQDSTNFWERPNFYSSPAISSTLDVGLSMAGLTKDQIDVFDFYSCFPIVPKLASHHLDLPMLNPPKAITLLGGLTSFGGAGNNYSMHAITAMTRHLRGDKGIQQHGLILANGGVMTYQHVVILSSQPRSRETGPYPKENGLPPVLPSQGPMIAFVEHVDGVREAVVETYTVDYHRDNTPRLGHIVGRLRNSGERFIANHGDEMTLMELCGGLSAGSANMPLDMTGEEVIGKVGLVRPASGNVRRNLFSFPQRSRL